MRPGTTIHYTCGHSLWGQTPRDGRQVVRGHFTSWQVPRICAACWLAAKGVVKQ